jgi:hypothetical protein
MPAHNVIARALQLIGVLLGAAGGFLIGIAPPDRVANEGSPRFAIGVATLAGLVLLLIISSITAAKSRTSHRTFWLSSGGLLLLVFLVSSVKYPSVVDELTFLYPEGVVDKLRYTNGTELTPAASAAAKRYETEKGFPPSKAKLVAGFAGVEHINRVWTPRSVRTAEQKLLIAYLVVTLSFMGAVFAVVEGTLRTPQTQDESAPDQKVPTSTEPDTEQEVQH